MEVEEEAKTKSKFKTKSVDDDGPKPEGLDFCASSMLHNSQQGTRHATVS